MDITQHDVERVEITNIKKKTLGSEIYYVRELKIFVKGEISRIYLYSNLMGGLKLKKGGI